MKQYVIICIVLLFATVMNASVPTRFRVLQENQGAVLSEFYYALPMDATHALRDNLTNNTAHIIQRYSLKALEEHKKVLTSTVDSIINVTAKTKSIGNLSSFKQEGHVINTLTVYNSTIQKESLVEEMTNIGRVYYLKQLVVFAVGRQPINEEARAFSSDSKGYYGDSSGTSYQKKIKTYAEYQAISRKGTILENHTTDAVDFVIENKDDEAIFFREVIYNDARLIKESLELSVNAELNKNAHFPVSVTQRMTLKLPKTLQKSLIDNYKRLAASNTNTQSMQFRRILKYDSKLTSGIYKDRNKDIEESVSFSITKLTYEETSKKMFLSIPNVYLELFIGDILSGYILLSSGDKVLDEAEIEVQYHTHNVPKANYKIRYEIVY